MASHPESDHCSLLLNLDNLRNVKGSKPSRFELVWTLDQNFGKVIDETWPKYAHNLDIKLECTRDALIDSNKSTFGNIYATKKTILSRLKGTQYYLQSHPLSRFHHDLEINLRNELIQVLDQEKLLWRTKSRLDKISQGERNASYLHKSVTITRAVNCILCLRDDVRNEIVVPREI